MKLIEVKPSKFGWKGTWWPTSSFTSPPSLFEVIRMDLTNVSPSERFDLARVSAAFRYSLVPYPFRCPSPGERHQSITPLVKEAEAFIKAIEGPESLNLEQRNDATVFMSSLGNIEWLAIEACMRRPGSVYNLAIWLYKAELGSPVNALRLWVCSRPELDDRLARAGDSSRMGALWPPLRPWAGEDVKMSDKSGGSVDAGSGNDNLQSFGNDDSMRQEIAGENDRRGSPDLGILPNSAEFDQISSPGFTPLAASIEGERLQPSPEGVSHQTRSRSSTSQMVGPLGSSKPGAGINGNVTEKEHPSISMDDGNVRQSPEGPPHQSRSRSSASQTVGPLRSSKPGAGANDNVAGEEHSSSVIRPDPAGHPRFGEEWQNKPLAVDFEACADRMKRLQTLKFLQRKGCDINQTHENYFARTGGKDHMFTLPALRKLLAENDRSSLSEGRRDLFRVFDEYVAHHRVSRGSAPTGIDSPGYVFSLDPDLINRVRHDPAWPFFFQYRVHAGKRGDSEEFSLDQKKHQRASIAVAYAGYRKNLVVERAIAEKAVVWGLWYLESD